MNTLQKHEIFEIEILEKLKSGRFLESLVFGGGSMLRLCYDLNRYSSDLDFWFIKKVNAENYFERLKKYLGQSYEITDAQIKFHTLLLELRFKRYPKRLKIEIRKKMRECDFQERIAFSKYGTKQVALNVHTLEQTMDNKIKAALERSEIRDCFDIEFLLRQGIELKASKEKAEGLKALIVSFKKNDYKVTLGSVLDSAERGYYNRNGFSYLFSKLK